MSAPHTHLQKRLRATVSEVLLKMIDENHGPLEFEPQTTVR
jgi:hypothetical protein